MFIRYTAESSSFQTSAFFFVNDEVQVSANEISLSAFHTVRFVVWEQDLYYRTHTDISMAERKPFEVTVSNELETTLY
jgi:hypothetical protein